jgi:hypothetical protein
MEGNMILCFIVSVIIGIALFLCAFLGFKEGLRTGCAMSQGRAPDKTQGPIQAIRNLKQDIELSKEAKEEAAEIDAMMNYRGDLPKE